MSNVKSGNGRIGETEMTNVLSKFSQPISSSLSDEEIRCLLNQMSDKLTHIYSYLIYARYEHDELLGWLVEYMVSQTDDYNTIVLENAVTQIYKTLLRNKYDTAVKYVLGYRQPEGLDDYPLYEPLITKLAAQQQRCWAQLEFEDLCQICRYVIIKL